MSRSLEALPHAEEAAAGGGVMNRWIRTVDDVGEADSDGDERAGERATRGHGGGGKSVCARVGPGEKSVAVSLLIL